MVSIDINMSESAEGGRFTFGCPRLLLYSCKGSREAINPKGSAAEGLATPRGCVRHLNHPAGVKIRPELDALYLDLSRWSLLDVPLWS